MLYNLLLSDPDNIPDGIGGVDDQAMTTLIISIIIFLLLITLNGVIYMQLKEKQKKYKYLFTLMIIADVIICAVLIILCYFALK